MRLNVSSILRRAGSQVGFDFSAEASDFFEDGLAPFQPVLIKGVVQNIGEDVLLATGTICTKLAGQCDRCLAPAFESVEIAFSERFAKATFADEGYRFEGDIINLAQMVREQLLLSTPAKWLCQTECKGLCPICGTDQNQIQCNCIIKRDNAFAALARYDVKEE